MNKMKIVKNPFGGIDEQAMTEQLESICGIDGATRLMQMRQEADQAASGNRYTLDHCKHVDPIAVFRKKAKNNGFTDDQINAYLTYDEHC